MNIKLVYRTVIGILFFTACQSHQQWQLDAAMQIAESNRKELEKVLLHYHNEPQKQQAAKFLIANMPFHFTYVAEEIDSLKKILKVAKTTNGIVADTIKNIGKSGNIQMQSKFLIVSLLQENCLSRILIWLLLHGKDVLGVSIIRLRSSANIYFHID